MNREQGKADLRSFKSYDLVAGCARHFTIFEEGTATSSAENLLPGLAMWPHDWLVADLLGMLDAWRVVNLWLFSVLS